MHDWLSLNVNAPSDRLRLQQAVIRPFHNHQKLLRCWAEAYQKLRSIAAYDDRLARCFIGKI